MPARWLAAAGLAAVGASGPVAAQDDDLPELSFLEYLGSWQDGDDEWLLMAEIEEIADTSDPDAIEEAPKQDDEAERSDED
ncbi:MAG: hypothetical protein R3305_02940 [Gammaproteobacteria bacterium]|nr:hypothetical protein [Gammaproteobacteria bacterium]